MNHITRTVLLIAGARPNFMKVAPVIRELQKYDGKVNWKLVHTGQHYDREMSDVFFEELGIPRPDFHMSGEGGSHAQQTARIMIEFEKYCVDENPAMVMVFGDVNSTLACSVVAKKFGAIVAHVEAGLRSNDFSMPEEVNRVVTDSISDLCFVTEESGLKNLLREGHSNDSVEFVGHVMIDNLFFQLSRLNQFNVDEFKTNSVKKSLGRFGVLTLHRPSNVDDKAQLRSLIEALSEISETLPFVFPVHPRTSSRLNQFGLSIPSTVITTPPLPYMEFLNLWKDAQIVLTDSGGLQEETTALGVPCLTLRDNTERPATVTHGSNMLVGTKVEKIRETFTRLEAQNFARCRARPPLWDGNASVRIVTRVLRELERFKV